MDEPSAVLTGDTLFIGDVGRPDLRDGLGWSADQLASLLCDSLHDKLARLPDDTLVYPAHGAGSLCGKNLSTETVSTIGIQRAHNYALAPMSREHFIDMVTADLPDAPPYFTYDALLNGRERATLDQTLQRAMRSLTLQQTIGLADGGAQLLDTRDAATFETAHLPGSVNIGLGRSYSTWCGTVLDPERPIVLIAEPGREVEAATGLGRIGFDTIAGHLTGGIDAINGDRLDLGQTSRITARVLAEQLSSDAPPLLIDVRTPSEWEQQRIPQAINISLATLAQNLDRLAGDRSLVVYCATGYRSAIAASLLKRAGFQQVSDLACGLTSLEARDVDVLGSRA